MYVARHRSIGFIAARVFAADSDSPCTCVAWCHDFRCFAFIILLRTGRFRTSAGLCAGQLTYGLRGQIFGQKVVQRWDSSCPARVVVAE